MDDAIALFRERYYLAKIDLCHAYRTVYIHPNNYRATGLKWKFQNSNKCTYMVDTRLPCGGRRAPDIFHRLIQAVKRMMARHGYKAIVVYLDDFLVTGATLAECFEIFNCLLELLQSLGFSINWKKVVPPTQCLIFLGVLINTVSQSMSLPHDKLVVLQELLLSFQHWRRASKRQLQGLAGKLNWSCRVVYGGRTFLRRILDTMNSMRSASARCLLDCGFYEDLNWWVQFLAVFSGRQLFLDSTPVVDVQTDTCFEAAGDYFPGDWVYLNFGMESPVLHRCCRTFTLITKRYWLLLWLLRDRLPNGLTNMLSFSQIVRLQLELSTKVAHAMALS